MLVQKGSPYVCAGGIFLLRNGKLTMGQLKTNRLRYMYALIRACEQMPLWLCEASGLHKKMHFKQHQTYVSGKYH